MSSLPILELRALSKRYALGRRVMENSLRAVLAGSARRFLKRLSEPKPKESDPRANVWALRDVTLDIQPGEMVGIIGHNGAGKSTLLKILSRITPPSEGEVVLRGRVGSLLEVGTGFHPELTGRENVYLSGTIMGMTKRELDRRFDEIVAFAEVEKFLDTPVKRYSSGMYVRLGFAVMAHLEPEILVVDEVIAVGDASFQRRCVAKMQEVGGSGRTVLFVTHNMAAIRAFCTRGIVLRHGQVAFDGAIEKAIDHYLGAGGDVDAEVEGLTTSLADIERIEVTSPNGVVATRDDCRIVVRMRAKRPIAEFGLYVGVANSEGVRVFGLDLRDHAEPRPLREGEIFTAGFDIAELPLLAGRYQLEIGVKDMSDYTIEHIPLARWFDVAEVPVYGSRRLEPRWFGQVAVHARPVLP